MAIRHGKCKYCGLGDDVMSRHVVIYDDTGLCITCTKVKKEEV